MQIHADLDPDPESCLMQNIISTCFKNSLKVVYVPVSVSVPVPVPILIGYGIDTNGFTHS